MRNGELLDNDNNETNSSNASSKKGGKKQKQHAYQTSGPGDAHILSNIHFLYQRLLKKFHYPLDVILNYAEFAKEHKSFNVMSRVYAEGLQRHPREEGLWIQVSFFEAVVCLITIDIICYILLLNNFDLVLCIKRHF
jgi:hypothetical protein